MRKKLPNMSKAELMDKITKDLHVVFLNDPEDAFEFLMNYMTTWDLVGIHEELREVKKSRERKAGN